MPIIKAQVVDYMDLILLFVLFLNGEMEVFVYKEDDRERDRYRLESVVMMNDVIC